MNIVDQLPSGLSQVWYLLPLLLFVPLLILLSVLKSRWFKGVSGEYLVNRLLAQLDARQYAILNDVTLPVEGGGSTQIDHILVSRYGVFVIETKNMKGSILGATTQRQWTQKINNYTAQFQNPLHQNYRHTQVLGELLDIPSSYIHSMVIFIGKSRFETEMPANVTDAQGSLQYIAQYQKKVLSDQQVADLVKTINSDKLPAGMATNRRHKKYVKAAIKAKADRVPVYESPDCPTCGEKMVLRKAGQGSRIGHKFWGCSQYPRCQTVVKFKS